MSLIQEYQKFCVEYSFRSSKIFGQNFLIDQNIVDKMMRVISDLKCKNIIEVGPGLGSLTNKLVKLNVPIKAVEIDKRLVEFLTKKFRNEKIELINKDILKYEVQNSKTTIISNVPYKISGPFLAYIIDNNEKIDSGFLTLQKEFIDKIFSRPGTKSYGYLSVAFNFFYSPAQKFSISNKVFVPVPKVDSGSFSFFKKTNSNFSKKDVLSFLVFVKKSFVHKRKTLINNWKDDKNIQNKLLKNLEKENIRAQEIPIKEWIRLFSIIK